MAEIKENRIGFKDENGQLKAAIDGYEAKLEDVATTAQLQEEKAAFQKQIDDLATREKRKAHPRLSLSMRVQAQKWASGAELICQREEDSFRFDIAVGDMTFANNFLSPMPVLHCSPRLSNYQKRKLHSLITTC